MSGRLAPSDERGAVATELAVLMPALILLVLMPVQVGLWWHAKQAATTAAEEAVDAAQVATATSDDGRRGAEAVLGRAGNLVDVSITVRRSPSDVQATITGDLGFSLFPGAWSVTAVASGPVERFVPETQR